MRVKLYIKNKEGEYVDIPLYGDEVISYQSKLSDAEDLSTVFNDSTNSFTIPATDESNDVFNYWFEIGVDDYVFGNGEVFDIKRRVDAYIEVNTLPYKYGKVSLLGLSYKDGLPEYYKIEFYGTLVKLNDNFLEDSLKDLKYLEKYNYEYSSENLLKTLNRPDELFDDLSIVTPFILKTDRNITVDGPDEGNILTVEGAIRERELRPGIKVTTVIKAIEEEYGITINSDFLNRQEVERLYLWMNEKDNFNNTMSWRDLEVVGDFPTFNGIDIINNRVIIFNNKSSYFTEDNILGTPDFHWTNSVRVKVDYGSASDSVNNLRFRLRNLDTNEIIDEVNSESDGWNISGNTLTASMYNRVDFKHTNLSNSVSRLVIEVSSSATFNVEYYVELEMTYNSRGISPPRYRRLFIGNTTTLIDRRITSDVAILDNIPDITVGDFFKGLMDMFRFIIIPEGENTFSIEPLEYYYSIGGDVDIKPFVDKSTIDVSRRTTYKELDFKWNEFDGILQEYFSGKYERNYGELNIYHKNLEGEKVIELPFINLMTSDLPIYTEVDNERVIESLVTVALMQSMDESGNIKENNKGLVLFYYKGITNLQRDAVKLKIGGNTEGIQYIPNIGLTDDYISSQSTNQLTWGEENVGMFNPTTDISLYNNWWKRWVNILYNKDSRLVYLEGVLDYPTLNSLKLNSNVIYNGDSFYIDELEINLLNGSFKLGMFPNFGGLSTATKVLGDRVTQSNINTSAQYCTIRLPSEGIWEISKEYIEGSGWIRMNNSFLKESSTLIQQQFNKDVVNGRYYNIIVDSNSELIYDEDNPDGYNESRRCRLICTNIDTGETVIRQIIQDGLKA